MKERPILFNAPMVRAILEGRKTQTRRIIKRPEQWQIEHDGHGCFCEDINGDWHPVTDFCPYGKVGDRLWVRETHYLVHQHGNPNLGIIEIDYKADLDLTQRMCPQKWRPSIHMPRWASRITLDITDIRVERLNEISDTDALAEGIELFPTNQYKDYGCKFEGVGFSDPRLSFSSLWQSINGYDSWTRNPWVWVIEFKRAT